MGIETKRGFSPVEVEDSGGQLDMLWSRYGFPGNAPKAGTPVEKRLQDKCREYAEKVFKYVIDPKRSIIQGSEKLRRSLHDEVAILIFGRRRDDLDIQTAENIAEFACELALGGTLDEIIEDYQTVADV